MDQQSVVLISDPGMSDNTRAAMLMVSSMAVFTLNDAAMKFVSSGLPFFELLFLRGAVTVVLLVLILRRRGTGFEAITPRDWRLIATRVVAEILSAVFFLLALFNLPIANVTAILQSLPLVITLAAVLFLGEAVGWRRYAAIFTGMIGVLIIIRPGTASFSIYGVYVLCAVVCVAVRDLTTRRIGSHVASRSVTLLSAIGVTMAAALASLTSPWVLPSPFALLMIFLAGCLIALGYHLSVMVMRVGDVSFAAPFRYSAVVWALLVGWIVFGEFPDRVTLIGVAIVVLSGLFMLLREKAVQAQQGE